jgi:hypothetical protein
MNLQLEETRKHIKWLQQLKKDLKYDRKTSLRKKDRIKKDKIK